MEADHEADALATARLSMEAMWAGDQLSQGLGISLGEARPGAATATMVVADHMVNGLGVCHGGVVFSLADTAMAFASNSRNNASFAVNADISWLRPAMPGDTLTARAIEISTGRTSIYDVTVTNQTGETVVVFRGTTRSTGRPLYDG